MSVVREKKFVVDGHEYEIKKLPTSDGWPLWLALIKTIAPIAEDAAKLSGLDDAGEDGAIEAIVSVLAKAVTHLDEAMIGKLITAFGKTCRVKVDEQKSPFLTGVVFDEHFMGRYVQLSQWVVECVVFNFADFLGDTPIASAASAIRKALAKASASKSPKASTGSSTASGDTSGTKTR